MKKLIWLIILVLLGIMLYLVMKDDNTIKIDSPTVTSTNGAITVEE